MKTLIQDEIRPWPLTMELKSPQKGGRKEKGPKLGAHSLILEALQNPLALALRPEP